MRALRSALFVVGLVLTVSCSNNLGGGSPSGIASIRTYTDSKLGYSIEIPSSWHAASSLSTATRTVLSNLPAADLDGFPVSNIGPYGWYRGDSIPASAEILVLTSFDFYPSGYCEPDSSPPPPPSAATMLVDESKIQIWANRSTSTTADFETIGVEPISGAIYCYAAWFGFGPDNSAGMSAKAVARNLVVVQSAVGSFRVLPQPAPRAVRPSSWSTFLDPEAGYTVSYPSNWARLSPISKLQVGGTVDIQRFSNSPEIVSDVSPRYQPSATGEYLEVGITPVSNLCSGNGPSGPPSQWETTVVDGSSARTSEFKSVGTIFGIYVSHGGQCYYLSLWFGSSVLRADSDLVVAGVIGRFRFTP